ncbi:MAG: ferric reductase-like transmembrane domain-containing protein [Sneathiellaceae bacterium]
MLRKDLLPWLDRSGRVSALRAIAFSAALLPGLWFALGLLDGRYDAEPYKQLTHLTGTWTLYFLLAGLAVTPLRHLWSWPRLTGIRRMLGLTAFAYIAAHLLLYVLHENLDLARVAGEIASRLYLTIGFAALAGLAVLAATSFDAAIRRLGRTWRRLHRAVYPLVALGLLHYFMQSKLDVSGAVLLSGLFVALLLHRLHDSLALRLEPVPRILAVALLAGLAAAGIEYAWYAIATGIPADRVLQANLGLDGGLRPAWQVAIGAALPLAVPAGRPVWRWLRPPAAGRQAA